MTEPDRAAGLNTITPETLAPLVSAALGAYTVQIGDWTYAAIHGGTGEVFGDELYRFQGQANVQGRPKQWELILKIIRADTESPEEDLTVWDYWNREALAYKSGLLDELPGKLTAPRCFGVAPGPSPNNPSSWWLLDSGARRKAALARGSRVMTVNPMTSS